jgi:peptide/nickel transport system ATP-binding protein
MLLNASDLSKSFGKRRVLDGVSFSVSDQELVSIMGPSGGGKSTIARILCGTVMPDSGAVTYRGKSLTGRGEPYKAEFRKNIQMIPQQPYAALDPRQKVGDAIAEPLIYHKIVSSRAEARHKAAKLMEKVGLEPGVYYDRRPSELSGGQAQRILIARSLTVSPELLIADEATSMLDISSQAQVIRIFQSLLAEGLSIILISHDKNLVDSISHRTYLLSDGKLSIDH